MKKITLGIAALFAAFTMNAQSDCSNAQAITVADDATTTVNASAISGAAPSTTCNTYAPNSITQGSWYSFTAGSNDLRVTVEAMPEDLTNSYVPTFNIYEGTCGDLSCSSSSVGNGRFYTTDNGATYLAAESSFLAESGQTYYIVFDDFYNSGSLGSLAAFDFTVTTDSNIPGLPGVATNPTPESGATDIPVMTGTLGQGNNAIDVYYVAASWDAPTTGDNVDEYFIIVSTNPDSSQWDGTNAITRTTDVEEPSTQFFSQDAIPNGFIQPNTTYYWTVQPTNVSGIPDGGTPIWSFTTGEVELGTKNIEDQSSLSHYVSNNSLNISSTTPLDNIVVFDMLGKKVSEKISNNNNNVQVDISSIQAGVYIAQVQVEGKTKTFKFVKK